MIGAATMVPVSVFTAGNSVLFKIIIYSHLITFTDGGRGFSPPAATTAFSCMIEEPDKDAIGGIGIPRHSERT